MYIYPILLKILERILNSCLLLDYLKFNVYNKPYRRRLWGMTSKKTSYLGSRGSFAMMVKWVNYGLLQSNDGKMHVNDGQMLVNDGQMLVNDGEISIWSCTHFSIIDYHFAIIKEHFTIISLKYTIIRSFYHNWEAAPTARVIFWRFFANFDLLLWFPDVICIFKTTSN